MTENPSFVDTEKLAQRCEAFMVGAKKLYDDSTDMWFFELFHHLEDCKTALRAEPYILPMAKRCRHKYETLQQTIVAGRIEADVCRCVKCGLIRKSKNWCGGTGGESRLDQQHRGNLGDHDGSST